MISCKALIDGAVIAEKVKKADRFFTRLKGLMWKKTINDDEGLLICPCRQIHTFFMRFPIDVLFLSESGEILFLKESMAPGKISLTIPNCSQVLELKNGTICRKTISVSKTVLFK